MGFPRLIFIEGLPGSGKSTTTQQLWLHLESLGREARWWYEHDAGHPVILYNRAVAARDSDAPDATAIFARALDGWTAVAAQLRDGGPTMLFEGTLLQTVMGTQLLMDRPRAEMITQFDRTMEILAPLHPVLIDLRPGAADVALRWAVAARPWFEELLVNDFARCVRGRRIGRSDLGVIVEYCAERCAISNELVARFPGRTLVHDNADRDWGRQRRAVCDFLGLPPMAPPAPPERAADYEGCFRATTTTDQITVASDAAGLHLTGDQPMLLLPHGRDRFVIESMAVELTFERGTDGRVAGFRSPASIDGMPPHWLKV